MLGASGRIYPCSYGPAITRPANASTSDMKRATIVSIGPRRRAPADREAGWVAPALFDLQINGCHGISFNSPDADRRTGPHGRRRVPHATASRGLLSDARHRTRSTPLAPRLRDAAPGDRGRRRRSRPRCPASTWKGRTSAGEDGPRGAHPREHVRDPDWDEFRRWQDAAGGRIRLVTLAPERPGALRVHRAAVDGGRGRRHRAHGGDAGRRSATRSRPGRRLSTHLGQRLARRAAAARQLRLGTARRRRPVGERDRRRPPPAGRRA